MDARTLAILALAALSVGGCASSPDPESLTTRPDDFSIAATILAPEDDPRSGRGLPRSLRPARYIVDPDGILRASVGPGSRPATIPPPTRQLTVAQLDHLWTLARDARLLESAAQVHNPDLAPPAPGLSVAIVEFAEAGRRAAVRIPLDRASTDSLAAEELIDHLAELAWVRQ